MRAFPTIVGVLVLLLATLPAAAQGTSGVFPGPINSKQLEAYGGELGLSDAQRLALEAEHDAYRERFRALREGEIADFLRAQASLQGGLPERERVVQLLDELAKVERRIAALDDGLFDRIVPILTDEQRTRLPRVRMQRERARYEPRIVQASMGRPVVDLSDVLRETGVVPDAAADATMASYERRLTTLMGKQADAVINMQLNMIDLLIDQGFGEMTQEELMQDPEQLQKIMAAIQAAYADLQAEVAELTADMRALNERTCRQVVSMLPPLDGRALRDRFYETSFNELAAVVPFSKEDWMSRAVELDTLTAEEREVLVPIAAAYRETVDSALEASYQSVAKFWANFSPFNLNPDRSYSSDIGEQRARLERARDDAMAALTAAIDAERVDAIRADAAHLARATSEDDAPRNMFGAAFMPQIERRPGIAADTFMPPAIDESDVATLARRLGLDSSTREVLEILLEDYRAAIDSDPAVEALRQALVDRGRALSDPNSDDYEAAAARVASARAAALDVVRAADEQFFESVRGVLGGDEHGLVSRLARHRERIAYMGSGDVGLVIGRDVTQEAHVDLVAIAFDVGVDMRSEAVGAVFDDYESRALDAFRERREARAAVQTATDSWMRELSLAAREDLAEVLALQTRYRSAMEAPQARLTAAEDAIAMLNREALARLEAALSPDDAARLRTGYREKGFPTVYTDPACVLDHASRALDLADLTSPQRGQLMDLIGEYRPEYDRLTDLMVEAVGSRGLSVVGTDAGEVAEWQQHQQEVTRLRFDRNELDARAISRLKSILSETQIAALGGLPEPLGDEDFMLFR